MDQVFEILVMDGQVFTRDLDGLEVDDFALFDLLIMVKFPILMVNLHGVQVFIEFMEPGFSGQSEIADRRI